ncbi:integral membrane protein [Colletotrichum musicola]|uniref:Integral membrane protein n=1 Tax=Colletotrichum musicola TaxID=2175873 RepID=A0A8H6JM79_9PEZI|nr:integral membrane protein [Colletotrichum musicola]
MSNATGPVGAFPPPPGEIPNFDDPRDAGWMWNVVGMSVMAAVTTFFFGIRTFVKFSFGTQFLMEDSTVFVMAHYGEGYHAWELTKESYQEVMRWLYASSIIYCPAAYFTKVTLLLLEARVFSVHPGVARGIRIFIVVLLICYIPLQTVKTIICLPISAFWNPKTPNPRCLNQRKIFIADLALAIVTDFFILVLPVPLLWGLRMPWQKKLKISALLGAGGIATAVTIYRLYLVILFIKSKDVTSDFVVLDLVTTLEIVIGVVCACLPSTNILYERLRRGETSPKTGRLPDTASDYKKRSDNSSYWWSMMTKGQTKAARTQVATVAEPMKSPRNPATFETELAVLAGQPMGMRPPTAEEPDTISVHFDEEWTYNPRANSIDGRREGWLASRGESSFQTDASAAAARSVAWQHHELEARKSWEAVWEQAIPAEGLSPVPVDPTRCPPRLKLTTHPLPDWEDLEQK